MIELQFRTREISVLESHFPQSDPDLGQAVACGGQPLSSETGMVGEEVDSSGEPQAGGLAARRSDRGRD